MSEPRKIGKATAAVWAGGDRPCAVRARHTGAGGAQRAADLVARLYHYREINGAVLAPAEAYALLRGMKTLALRVERQNASALEVARWLARHPAVDKVNYPGLESHEHHDVARRQMRGFGGMLSFSLRGGLEAIAAAAASRRSPPSCRGCATPTARPTSAASRPWSGLRW